MLKLASANALSLSLTVYVDTLARLYFGVDMYLISLCMFPFVQTHSESEKPPHVSGAFVFLYPQKRKSIVAIAFGIFCLVTIRTNALCARLQGCRVVMEIF